MSLCRRFSYEENRERSGEGEYLLLGGGGHRTGKKFGCNPEAAGKMLWDLWGKAGQEDKAVECAAWSAQDCMPHDRIPFIGRDLGISALMWGKVWRDFQRGGLAAGETDVPTWAVACFGIRRKERKTALVTDHALERMGSCWTDLPTGDLSDGKVESRREKALVRICRENIRREHIVPGMLCEETSCQSPCHLIV